MQQVVDLVVDRGIGQITIHRPAARNALTWRAMEAFGASVDQAHQVSDLRALIVCGEGGWFCAGGDLFELDGYPTRLDGVRLGSVMTEALDRLEALAVPTIAAIEGPALGGGAEIALACDVRIMADGAALGMMHVRLAIPPAWGGGQRLVRLVGYARAIEWLAAGRVFAASEALQAGLVNRAVGRGEAIAEALTLAQDFAANDAQAVRAVKRIARAATQLPVAEAVRVERDAFPDLWAAPAHLEASAAFVAKRNHRPRPA